MRVVAALLALPLAVAALAQPAAAATRNFPVPSFSKLRVEGPYTVRVHTGASPSVKANGPQARIDKLIVESRGDTLVVTTDKSWEWRGTSWGKNDAVTVDISVLTLEAAELTGSGDVSVDRVRTTTFSALLNGSGDLSVEKLETARLNASVAGSGDLTIAGRTGRADASVKGSGDIHAAGLSVNMLNASVTGSGDITVGPTQVAKANVVGSGDITVGGRPNCSFTKTGSGDIRCGDKLMEKK